MFEKLLDLIVKFWDRFGVLSRIFSVVALATLAFIFIRVGAFGKPIQEFSKRIVSTKILYLDEHSTIAEIYTTMKIQSNGKAINFLSGKECPSEAVIQFNTRGNTGGWVAMFGVSKSGIYPLQESGLRPKNIEGEFSVLSEIELDNETGIEMFGFVLSPKQIDFDDIKKHILEYSVLLQSFSGSKGGKVFTLFEALPDDIARDSLFCIHNE